MDDVSIKVNIADVVYPLRVTTEDEPKIRKAAKMINDKIKAYRDDYQLADKSNLLSMVALQFAVELVQFKDRQWIEDINISADLAEIEKILLETNNPV